MGRQITYRISKARRLAKRFPLTLQDTPWADPRMTIVTGKGDYQGHRDEHIRVKGVHEGGHEFRTQKNIRAKSNAGSTGTPIAVAGS